jgi:hypothetical protein
MRKKQQKQMPLIEPASGHPQEMELEIMFFKISMRGRLKNETQVHKE